MKPRISQMKLKRNQSLIRYKQNHPLTSLASIGRIYHISRQRVFTLVNHHRAEVTEKPRIKERAKGEE